jgi:hypothetical protein
MWLLPLYSDNAGEADDVLGTLSAVLLELQDVSVFVEGFFVPQP